MVFRKSILSLTVAFGFGALSAYAAASPAQSKNKVEPKSQDHVLRGTVVAVSDGALTLRSGKKDTTFKIDSSTQKPASMGPGTEIAVTYHDDGKQHIASNIEPSVAKAIAANPKSHK